MFQTMIQNYSFHCLRILFLFLASHTTTHAAVVRMEIAFGDQFTDEIYIELFDTATATRTAAPITVDNFMRYIEEAGDRRYDGTFFHRILPDFVLQGGGFKFDPNQGPAPIESYGEIINEFDLSRSNLRGTIAMAKIATGPDTATSQWFFNLVNNNDPDDPISLDNQNGGFTVFGRVIGNSLLVLDNIAALPITNLPLSFRGEPSPIPFVASDATSIDNTSLIQLSRVEIYQIPQTAVLSLSEKNELAFGDAGPGVTRELEFSVANLGSATLTFTLQLTGQGDAASFAVTNNCGAIEFGDSCTETLTFAPVVNGVLEAQLEVSSNDPNTPNILIPISGFASGDNDGISDAIEAAGPNNGDANRDGIPDALQDYVTSFPNTNNQYITLDTNPELKLTQVQTIDNPSPFDTPEINGGSLSFGQGFYSFNLENVAVGGSATVTMTLPEGEVPSHYFKYGREPNDDPTRVPLHWYLFNYDGVTGAEIQGNRIILHFINGSRDDNDQQANGIIVDPGGPAIFAVNSNTSSGDGGCSTLHTASRLPAPIDFILLLSGLLILKGRKGIKVTKTPRGTSY